MATPTEPLSKDALRAWRFMRDAGGYWSAGDLGDQMFPGLGSATAAMRASRYLSALARREHIAIHPRVRRVNYYGVTARCVPPEGETLEPSDNNTWGTA